MAEQQPHITIALDDPINQLRMELYDVVKNLPAEAQRLTLAESLGTKIEQCMFASGVGPDSVEHKRFVSEMVRAKAWLNYLFDESAKSYPGSPNPEGPWAKLLWANVIALGTFKESLKESSDGFEASATETKNKPISDVKNDRIRALYEQLAHSDPMQRSLTQFCMNTEMSKRGIDYDTTVQYGLPGSWFWCARNVAPSEDGSSMEESGAPHINLDLYFSLLLGDYVEPIFEHEMEHAEKTHGMPAFLEEHWLRYQAAKKQLMKEPIKITAGDSMSAEKEALVREYLAEEYAYTLAHSFYNAAEDNMCNQGVSDLSNPDIHHPPYPYDLSYALSVIHALLGFGETWNKNESAKNEAIDAAAEFRAIGNAVNEAFFMRNGKLAVTEANLIRSGLRLDKLQDTHTGAQKMQAFGIMYDLCEDIANTQPPPGLRKFKNYNETTLRDAAVRNTKIQTLFERFGKDAYERALEDYRNLSLQDQIDQLQETIRQLEQQIKHGADTTNTPDEQEAEKDQDLGGVTIEVEGVPIQLPGARQGTAGKQGTSSQGGIGKPTTWGEQVAKAAEIGSASTEKGQGQPTTLEKGVGMGSEGIAKLTLGDGRTFTELRADPLYQQARAEMVHELIEIARKFKHDAVAHGEVHQLLPTRTPAEDFDIGRGVRAGIAIESGAVDEDTFHLFQSTARSPEATPGELWLNVDFSGSMGIGIGSDLEVAVKSAAMVWDAAQEAAHLDPAAGKFRIHLLAWGNTVPSKITDPDMNNPEALARIDGVLQKVFNNERIPNLHGGTDADGALNAMMSNLARFGDEQNHELSPEAPVGWLGGLFVSDGYVAVGYDLNNTEELLRLMPNLTLDAGITGKLGTSYSDASGVRSLETYITQASEKAKAAGETMDRGFCFNVPSGAHEGISFPQALMGWIRKRSEQLSDRPSLTRQEVETYARNACSVLNRPGPSTTDIFHAGTITSPLLQTEHSRRTS